MVWSERLLENGQCPLVEPLCLSVTALNLVEDGEVIEVRRDIGMLGTQRLLVDGQRPLE